eukprot:151951_1
MANKNYFDHSVDTNGYNPHKDPYFGQMNMKSMGQSMGKSRPGHGTNVYGHRGGRFHPPTGNKNDPYGLMVIMVIMFNIIHNSFQVLSYQVHGQVQH